MPTSAARQHLTRCNTQRAFMPRLLSPELRLQAVDDLAEQRVLFGQL
jgi:hypothetical protein